MGSGTRARAPFPRGPSAPGASRAFARDREAPRAAAVRDPRDRGMTSCRAHFLERPRERFDVLLLENQGWKEPDDVRVGARSHENLPLQEIVANRRRRSPAAEAEKETRALYRLDGTDRARRTDELRDAADVLEKAVGLDDVEDGFHEGAGERAAAEGRAQASHRCVARDLLGREHRSHGKTGGESFRGREDVRRHSVLQAGEVVAGPSDARLDLVENQDGSRLVAALPQSLKKLALERDRTPHPLDGLDDHCCRPLIDGFFEPCDVVPGNERHRKRSLRERGPLRSTPGYGRRRRRSPVEAMLQGHDLLAGMTGEEREPERVLVRFCAALHEEDPGQAGRRDSDKLVRGAGTHLEGNGVRLEGHRGRLTREGLDHARMRVAESGDGVASIEVEDLLARGGAEEDTSSRDEIQRKLRIHLQQMSGFGRDHQIHPGAGCVSPIYSGSPTIRFSHWTPPPAAPFNKLSIAEKPATVSPSAATPRWAKLLPATSFTRGAPGTTRTSGESA